MVNKRRVFNYWIIFLLFPYSISTLINIPVVKGELYPGQMITSENWIWGTLPNNKLTRFMIQDPFQMKGMLSRYIKKSGDIFYQGDVTIPDVIHNQDKLTLTVRTGQVQVSVPGIALKNGALGCTIKVLNPATQKILDAVIIDSRNVEVIYN